MKVLVDTSVWSFALRRKKELLSSEEKLKVKELNELIKEVRVVIIGPIRQEILSGISNTEQFLLLKQKLGAFEDLQLTTADYELGAEFYNRCRKSGIQGSHTDFLICAAAYSNKISVFTIDNDFKQYAKYLEIKLYKERKKF